MHTDSQLLKQAQHLLLPILSSCHAKSVGKGMIEVLLIDKSQQNAELLSQALKRLYPDVLIQWVQSGKEALDFIFATGAYNYRMAQPAPKLILLNTNHPSENPAEIIPILKSYARTSRLPVIAIGDKPESTASGANTYIVWGTDTDQFIRSLELVIMYWLTNPVNQAHESGEQSDMLRATHSNPKVYH